MKNQIQWDWKETVSGWDREKIIEDLLQECYVDSVIFTMAKLDIYGIINKSNYNFIIHSHHFDSIYSLAAEVTKEQVKKFKNGKKSLSFLHSHTCPITTRQMLQKIISRITNNMRNLFDKRYKNSLTTNSTTLSKSFHTIYVDFLEHQKENCIDPLQILINEENELELDIFISKIDSESIKDIFK